MLFNEDRVPHFLFAAFITLGLFSYGFFYNEPTLLGIGILSCVALTIPKRQRLTLGPIGCGLALFFLGGSVLYFAHLPVAVDPQATALRGIEWAVLAILATGLAQSATPHDLVPVLRLMIVVSGACIAVVWAIGTVFSPTFGLLNGRLALGFGEADVTAAWLLGSWWFSVAQNLARPTRWAAATTSMLALSISATHSRAVLLLLALALALLCWRRSSRTARPIVATFIGASGGFATAHGAPPFLAIPLLSIVASWVGERLDRTRMVRRTLQTGGAWVLSLAVLAAGIVVSAERLLRLRSTAFERLAMWDTALRIFFHYPLGLGANTFGYLYGRFEPYGYVSSLPHSLAFSMLVDMGIVGVIPLALLLGVLIASSRNIRRRWLAALPAALILHALVDVDANFLLMAVLWIVAAVSLRPGLHTRATFLPSNWRPLSTVSLLLAGIGLASWMLATVGTISAAHGRLNQAITWEKAALRVDPWSASATFYQAQFLRASHNALWVPTMTDATDLFRSQPTTLIDCALAWQQGGQQRRALATARIVIHDLPYWPSGYILYDKLAWADALMSHTPALQRILLRQLLASSLAFLRRIRGQPTWATVSNRNPRLIIPVIGMADAAALALHTPSALGPYNRLSYVLR